MLLTESLRDFSWWFSAHARKSLISFLTEIHVHHNELWLMMILLTFIWVFSITGFGWLDIFPEFDLDFAHKVLVLLNLVTSFSIIMAWGPVVSVVGLQRLSFLVNFVNISGSLWRVHVLFGHVLGVLLGERIFIISLWPSKLIEELVLGIPIFFHHLGLGLLLRLRLLYGFWLLFWLWNLLGFGLFFGLSLHLGLRLCYGLGLHHGFWLNHGFSLDNRLGFDHWFGLHHRFGFLNGSSLLLWLSLSYDFSLSTCWTLALSHSSVSGILLNWGWWLKSVLECHKINWILAIGVIR